MRQRNPYRPPTAREQVLSIYEVLTAKAGSQQHKVSLEDVARRYLETQEIAFDRLSPAEKAAICHAIEEALSD
jgi:uncharacterized protein (DUF427 family)